MSSGQKRLNKAIKTIEWLRFPQKSVRTTCLTRMVSRCMTPRRKSRLSKRRNSIRLRNSTNGFLLGQRW